MRTSSDNMITYSVLEEENEDFLDDPDLLRDALPQPYRRIDRILEDFLENTWSLIENLENEKKIESGKYRPKKFTKLTVLKDLENINCMSPSTDDNNEFVFVGLDGSISCLDADGITVLDKAEIFDDKTQQSKENSNITSICSSRFNNQVHFVVSISSTGYVFMHLFCINKFYHIPYEMDGDKKYFYRKCEMTKNCSYLAFFLEQNAKNSQPDLCLIEVYKCPKELWAQYVENLYVLKQEDANEVAIQQLPTIQKPTLMCKMRPPTNLIKTSITNYQSMSQLLKLSESANQEVIGLGINNCFTKSHLELKTQTFEKFYNVQLSEEIENQITGNFETDSKIDVEIKFLHSNRLLNVPINLDQLVEIPNGLAVCWNKTNQILFYPFIRLTKDLESRVEYSLPFSSPIMQIELSECNTLIGIVLKNNNLVVFDLISGIDRCCINFQTVDSIKRISFMPPPLPPNKSMLNLKSTENNIPTKILCLLSNGEMHVVDCTMNSDKKTEKIFIPCLSNKDDVCIDFFPCSNLPNLMIVLSITEKLFIFEISKKKMLIELSDDKLDYSYMEKIYGSFVIKNQLFYAKGQVSKEDNNSKILCHSLRNFPQLEDYFAFNNNTQYFCNFLPSKATLNDRVKIFMEKRIDEMPMRNDRLKKVWDEIQMHRNI